MKSNKIGCWLLAFMMSAIFLFSGTAAIATTSGNSGKKSVFDIVTKIYVDGKLVSSPRIIAFANQKAAVEFSDSDKSDASHLRMEYIASDVDGIKNAIKINYDVQYKSGKETIHSKPRIVVLPKQHATIRFTTNSGHVHVWEMRILAKRA